MRQRRKWLVFFHLLFFEICGNRAVDGHLYVFSEKKTTKKITKSISLSEGIEWGRMALIAVYTSLSDSKEDGLFCTTMTK